MRKEEYLKLCAKYPVKEVLGQLCWTPTVAAKKNNRHYIGFEISAEYCNIIKQRLEQTKTLISPDYARNFICDFILGKKQDIGQLSLF